MFTQPPQFTLHHGEISAIRHPRKRSKNRNLLLPPRTKHPRDDVLAEFNEFVDTQSKLESTPFNTMQKFAAKIRVRDSTVIDEIDALRHKRHEEEDLAARQKYAETVPKSIATDATPVTMEEAKVDRGILTTFKSKSPMDEHMFLVCPDLMKTLQAEQVQRIGHLARCFATDMGGKTMTIYMEDFCGLFFTETMSPLLVAEVRRVLPVEVFDVQVKYLFPWGDKPMIVITRV